MVPDKQNYFGFILPLQRENEFSCEPLDAHYQTDLNNLLHVHVVDSSAKIKRVAMKGGKYLHKSLQDLGHNSKHTFKFCFKQSPLLSYRIFSPEENIQYGGLSQVRHDVVTHSGEKHTAPRSSFPFPLPCHVLSLFSFFPLSLSSGLHMGGAKEHKLINPFQTGRFCSFITGQNSFK